MRTKILYSVAGLFVLLPLSIAATRTTSYLVRAIGPTDSTPWSSSAWGFIIGFFLWLFLYFALPRPIKTYVLAHELTHALWGFLMGAKVKGLKVSSKGGSVKLSKSNFLITLAPYFFPFYSIAVTALYLLLHHFYDLTTYQPFWLGLIGLTWSFHLTFTATTLMEQQTDVQEYGPFFSYLVIYCFNVIGIALWITMIGSPTFEELGSRFSYDLMMLWEGVSALITLKG